MKQIVSLLLFAALIGLPVSAAELFNNGVPDPVAGATASNFAGHDPEYELQAADDFYLATASTITHVRWWGIYQGSNVPLEPDLFTLRIFADESGSPAATPLIDLPLERVRRSQTGLTSAGYDVYEYTAVLAPHVTLAAGTYWLSIMNDVDTEEVGTDWLWMLSSNSTGNFVARVNDSAPWEPLHTFALAFEIKGVPHRNP
jgi:hypothetical protein